MSKMTIKRAIEIVNSVYMHDQSGVFEAEEKEGLIGCLKRRWKVQMMAIDNVRPSVYLHARKMEGRLRGKDATKGKDGWHDGNLSYYLAKVAGCVSFVSDIIRVKTNKDKDIVEANIHLAIKKCIDGSNFLMMLADNLRDELVKRGIRGNGK